MDSDGTQHLEDNYHGLSVSSPEKPLKREDLYPHQSPDFSASETDLYSSFASSKNQVKSK